MRSLSLTPDGRIAHSALLDDPGLLRLLDILNEAGEETRVIGGAVRNALLSLAPGDVDLATTAVPGTVVERARKARLRTIPTGIAHGTVTVIVGGRPFEVTTLREDVETDGRHATVRFGHDFGADAQRRDFTVNALSLDAGGTVHDTVGGLDDLAAGRIRFIGDASTRIREDHLRILRFFRFHAFYGSGPLDPGGLEAAVRNRDFLEHLSRERVRAEFLKLLCAPAPLDVLRAMATGGILDLILGGRVDLDRLARLIAMGQGSAPDATLRLAALALFSVEDAARLRGRLRLSNADLARVAAAAEATPEFEEEPPDLNGVRRALFLRGREAASDALRLVRAGKLSEEAAWSEAIQAIDAEPVPVPPFSGRDLMARGLNGAELGAALARLREAWAAAGFPNDRAAVVELLDVAASTPSNPDHAG